MMKKRWVSFSLGGVFLFFLLYVLTDFVVMPAYVQQGKSTKVPQVVGLSLTDAKRILSEQGLSPREFETRPDKQYPVGTVVQQSPMADDEVKFGRGIYLTVSGGELLVPVPLLRGRSLRDASFSLEKSGLKLGTIGYQASDELFENTIIGQDIGPGARVKGGTAIGVLVSTGKDSARQVVPVVTMKTMSEAEKILTQAGFRIGTITYQSSLDILPNTVTDQYPRGGELGRIGQPVDLFVAQKAEKKTPLEN